MRPGKNDRTGKPARISRPDKPKKTYKSGIADRPERSGKAERDTRPEKPARPDREKKSGISVRPARKTLTERLGKPHGKSGEEIAENVSKPARPAKADWTKNPGRLNRPDRTGRPKKETRRGDKNEDPGLIRLNKYISNSGICSRREADKLIEAGAVSVNGKIITELGTKVGPTDKVLFGDQAIRREKPQYVLLNKPKGFITTVHDPDERKTVMSLVAGACKERIYPVGRLDRNTTGLLLFTNDGEITKKLTHPRYGIKKIYHVEIDKALTRADYLKIEEGIRLDDEIVRVDRIEYIGDGKDKKQIGLELHTGQNRIVRRIFEHFEYKVLKLDRVYYAGLTKKNLPRGHWRFLEEQEINLLKMISSKT